MKYTIRQLEIFLEVARQQNISRAAETLHLSQSAASEALQNLEQNYGVSLFSRSHNRIKLSATGQTLRREAENLLSHCKSFDQLLLGHTDFGHVRVGASHTIGNYIGTVYLANYLDKFPSAQIQLDTLSTRDIISKVLNYEVDIGMIEGEVHDANLELVPWRKDELLVFCSNEHPLANKTVLRDHDITSAKWILREPDSSSRRAFEAALGELLPEINVFLEFKHNEAIKSAVFQGLGVGCLSQIAIGRNVQGRNLVPLKLYKRDLRRNLYFVLPKNFHRTPAMNAWIENCLEVDRGNRARDRLEHQPVT